MSTPNVWFGCMWNSTGGQGLRRSPATVSRPSSDTLADAAAAPDPARLTPDPPQKGHAPWNRSPGAARCAWPAVPPAPPASPAAPCSAPAC